MLHGLLLCCVHTIRELPCNHAHQTVLDGNSDFPGVDLSGARSGMLNTLESKGANAIKCTERCEQLQDLPQASG